MKSSVSRASRSLAFLLRASLATLAVIAASPAAAVEYAERGIFRFDSKSGCPIAPEGDAASPQCNRLALDDEFVRADLFVAQRLIVFADKSGATAGKRVAGDVLLHGKARAANGQQVPVALHVTLVADNGRWQADAHVHAPLPGKLSDVKIDPYVISVREGDATRVVFSPQQAKEVFADATPRVRLGAKHLQLRDNRAGQPPKRKDARAADITVGVGATTLEQPLLRAQLEVRGDASPDMLNDTLLRGNWTLQLDAAGALPADVVRRQLFLARLDHEPLLRPFGEKGWPKGAQLTLGVEDNRGFLRVNGKEVEYDSAALSASSFLQDSLLGLALLWRVTQP